MKILYLKTNEFILRPSLCKAATFCLENFKKISNTFTNLDKFHTQQ